MLTRQMTNSVLGLRNGSAKALGCKNVNGASYADVEANNVAINKYSQNYLKVIIGSGETAPSYDDYNLESPLSLTQSSNTWSAGSQTNDGTIYLVSTTYTNTTQSAVTVKEVGIWYYCYWTSSTMVGILLARTVLSSPVTIEAGEAYTFTYRLSI